MLEILMPTMWTCFTVYAAWYFTSAKHYAPLTLNEARLLWRIHKNNTRCTSRKWNEIRHSGSIIGFKCECGYKHVQKRPVVS
ncbi:MAG: hypothetical protein NWE85_05175 [Candidatus Bathyarchaeota archaeon]|nr:hypothetical protein [Candidatus Bathyarchaeota archaeon]